MQARSQLLPVLVPWVWLAACTGQIDGVSPPGGQEPAGGRGAAGGQPPRGGERSSPVVGTTGSVELPFPPSYDGEPSILRRLSRDEIIASMQVLVGVGPKREDLPSERCATPHAPYTTVAAALIAQEVDTLLLALENVAAKAGASAFARSGCKATGEAQRTCLVAYAGGIARRAFRRELTSVEKTRLAGIFSTVGASPADDADATTELVRAVFFSPSFLYRRETGAADDVATRLSFLATLAPPDDELIAAARSGALADPETRRAHLDRLLATEAGKQAMAAFVLEHLGASESHIGDKSMKYLAGLPADHAAAVRASALASIKTVLADSKTASLEAVLTSRSWVDDAAMEPIRQAGEAGIERMGLLMHPYVIAAHTKENGVSPFVIGMFLRESLLCEDVPPPPPNAGTMARTDPPAGASIREDLEYRTGATASCSSCHALFAPLGYAFLPFDPVGRWVKQDPSGKPWNLKGTVSLSKGTPLVFDGPGSLVWALARHPQVHGCFAQAALTWGLGRRPVPADADLLNRLAETSVETAGRVPDLFRALVQSPDFVNVVVSR